MDVAIRNGLDRLWLLGVSLNSCRGTPTYQTAPLSLSLSLSLRDLRSFSLLKTKESPITAAAAAAAAAAAPSPILTRPTGDRVLVAG